MASYQSITTVRNVQTPKLLTDLHTCLESINQQSADQLLQKILDYANRTIHFIARCYNVKPDSNTQVELLKKIEYRIEADMSKFRRPIPSNISTDEKNFHLQMHLSIDLFTQSVRLLNETRDPHLFAALAFKSTESLYTYFKHALLLRHLTRFGVKAPREMSVVDLYGAAKGSQCILFFPVLILAAATRTPSPSLPAVCMPFYKRP